MVQEDKDLLRQLSAIMEENKEMKRRLEALETAGNDKSEKSVNAWKSIYKNQRIDTAFKLKKSGNGVFLEVPWTQKNHLFFEKISIAYPKRKKKKKKERMVELTRKQKKKRSKHGYVTIVLLKARFLDDVQSIWKEKHPLLGRHLTPNLLPEDKGQEILPSAEFASKTYAICKASLRLVKGGYLRLYFSKVWSEMILYGVEKKQLFIGQELQAPQIWEMENTFGSLICNNLKKKISFPCKAKFRWEKNDDLIINIPSWLHLIGSGPNQKNFNLWFKHSFSPDGNITTSNLFKKASKSLFRTSRKSEFYRSMKEARDSGTINSQSGIVEFIVALSPNPIYSE